ncbi:MAG: (2Fe-2S)-binding protein [Actinomycetia bacterium]|nr:(2Fe-2S)-binding protein [Actinomycetes bacterium]
MVRLTIDGQEVVVPEGTTVVDAAAQIGIEIPIYCYHQALGSLGACRICLVEIEKMPKLQTACTTRVAEGMVVRTQGPAVDKGRRGILEFLLINHPLDCPVCDKGGECFLQDYAFRYGPGKNRFEEAKIQRQKDYPVSPYILLDQERCVLCQRCVRFLGEYVGEEQLVLSGRGVHTVVTTVDDRPATSPFAGNVIDLCPVGALLSEPYHFKARPWNIEREESTCVQCPVGCPTAITGRDGRLVRMEGRPIPGNWGFLCDTGRFSYDFGRHPDRLTTAVVEGRPATLGEATRLLGERLKAAVAEAGPDAVAVLTGGALTVEDDHAVATFFREVVGTTRLGLVKPVPGAVPLARLGTYEDLAQADTVLLLHVDPYEAVPVVHLMLREAQRKRRTAVWGLGDRVLTRETLVGRDVVVEPGTVGATLAAALAAETDHPDLAAVAAEVRGRVSVPEGALAMARALLEATHLAVLWDGLDAEAGPVLEALARARDDRRTAILPTHGPRSWLGAVRAGIPTDTDATRAILEAAAAGRIRTLVLWGADPLRDFPDPDLAERALAACPDVFWAGWFPPAGSERMTALLPLAAWGEVAGTYVNLEGRLQVARPAANSPGQARPAGAVLRAVARAYGAAFHLEDFDPFEDQDGERLRLPAPPDTPLGPVPVPRLDAAEGLTVILGQVVAVDHWPSEILTRTEEAHPARLAPEDAARLGVALEGGRVVVEADGRRLVVGARPDARIPRGRLFLPLGLARRERVRPGTRVAITREEEVARR